MKIAGAIRQSLRLLPPSDRRRLILVTVAQAATSFLDLAGVLLLGVTTALFVASTTGAPPPPQVTQLIEWLGLGDWDLERVAVAVGLVAATALVAKSLLSLTISRKIIHFLAGRQAVVSAYLTERLLTSSLTQIHKANSQQTIYALTSGVNYATLMILSQLTILIAELTLLGILTVGLLVINPLLTIASLVFFVLVAAILQRVLSDWAARVGEEAQQAEIQSWTAIQEAIRNFREIAVLGRRPWYVNRVASLRWAYSRAQAQGMVIGILPKYVLEIALVVGAGLLTVSQLRLSSLTQGIATLTIFLAAGSRVVPSLLRLQSAQIIIRNASSQAQPTFLLAEQLERNSAGSPTAQSAPPSTTKDEVRRTALSFEQVCFAYPESKAWALRDVSLTVEQGTSLAIVGPTGAGKSTLVDVLLGFLTPQSGQVLIQGMPPESALAESPGRIAYVPQTIGMALGSIRDNVALAVDPTEVNDEAVLAALHRAQLEDLVASLPRGIDTQVGELGFKLSGGQRQRLGIARALYTNPELLILDEATSALDAETEASVSETLTSLVGTVTLVVIAHRLATVRNCDQVGYLEDGCLVDIGTFDEVRRNVPGLDRQARILGI